jgi:hypothetical protein
MSATRWSKPYSVRQEGKRKPVEVETALLKGHKDRFHLYQTNAGMIPSMWTLYDQTTGAQHFLCANGRPEAQTVASRRLNVRYPHRRRRGRLQLWISLRRLYEAKRHETLSDADG